MEARMKAVKGLVALGLIILALRIPLGVAQSGAYESDKARIVSLENVWNEAEKHKDAKAIDGLLAPTFAYTDSDGTFMNKGQYLASITEAGYNPDQIVNESMEVRAYDRAAVVTGTYREKGMEKGKAYSRRGRFTDMWVQEENGWFCAASHETLIGR
ncbi:MAG: nuclear transport factor 2 family protein [Candidatus Sulfotelmatobacter sp.]